MTKILIVEDDNHLGLMLTDLLEFKGYHVILLREPKRTLENIITHSIDLVLMDKLISGVDGTDICREIRADKRVSQTPILMMSALNNASEACLSAGATGFISKPFEITDLENTIKDILASQ